MERNYFEIEEINDYYIQIKIFRSCTRDEIYNAFHLSKSIRYSINEQLPYKLNQYESYVILYNDREIHKNSLRSLEIIYEDEILIAVNKPPFLLVHDDGNNHDSLQDQVNHYLGHSTQALHRLDYQTSGIVLFSKHKFFQPLLDKMISSHLQTKEYYCLVEGYQPSTEVHLPIARNRHTNGMICHKNGKEAHTYINHIKTINDQSLLDVKITTGRKHQIRVHCATLGHPIINDPLYGHIIDQRGMLLQHFHFAFKHPLTNEDINLSLPMDKRFEDNDTK